MEYPLLMITPTKSDLLGLILLPLISRMPHFSNQFSLPLEIRETEISLYTFLHYITSRTHLCSLNKYIVITKMQGNFKIMLFYFKKLSQLCNKGSNAEVRRLVNCYWSEIAVRELVFQMGTNRHLQFAQKIAV